LYQQVAQMYQTSARPAPRGAARRDAILRAAIELVGEEGPDALTHRAVAERAGVAVSATTYWFSSKEEIFREAVALAAHEEVERLERLVLDLAPRHVTPAAWARALSTALAEDLRRPARPVAMFQFVLEASREPALREQVLRWEAAHLRLAEAGLRAAGSDDPQTDAHLVVAAVAGLMLAQLTTPQRDFEPKVLRPTLERLFTRLAH
jgi:TetR/AcrR family transcriptional regulator, regulator of biofilm formation and stress response